MGLIIPALSLSLKGLWQLKWGEKKKKTQVRGDWKVEITLPLQDFILTLPFVDFSDSHQPPAALLPAASRSFDVSSSWKFCSVVYTPGFEAIHQNSSARNCIKMLAAGGWFFPNVLLVPTKEHWRKVGRGFFPPLSAKPCILWCHLKSEVASSSGTFHKMWVWEPHCTSNYYFFLFS